MNSSGPTDGRRILGTLASGQKPEWPGSQARSESGRIVWIPIRDLEGVPGKAECLPEPERKVAERASSSTKSFAAKDWAAALTPALSQGEEAVCR
ncbi:SH3 type 3 domain-containing protein [Pseudomonas sp. ATCC 13867]|nr:SH3 type 3 domain-containing protein [Pseudomonas sp. ATCC 13867]